MREDIKKIWLADRWTYDSVLEGNLNESDDNRKYFVYEWHTSNNKIFYVGKGTGKRYDHILKEIETYENNPRKYKGKNYKILKDEYGIDYSIIMTDLTENEALIMEAYYIIKYLAERQPLLNQILPPVPDYSYEYWYNVHYKGELLDYFK